MNVNQEVFHHALSSSLANGTGVTSPASLSQHLISDQTTGDVEVCFLFFMMNLNSSNFILIHFFSNILDSIFFRLDILDINFSFNRYIQFFYAKKNLA